MSTERALDRNGRPVPDDQGCVVCADLIETYGVNDPEFCWRWVCDCRNNDVVHHSERPSPPHPWDGKSLWNDCPAGPRTPEHQKTVISSPRTPEHRKTIIETPSAPKKPKMEAPDFEGLDNAGAEKVSNDQEADADFDYQPERDVNDWVRKDSNEDKLAARK